MIGQPSTSLPIVIAGAGIGGLCAALAAATAGRQVLILEKAPALTEAGAGIQLSPNASVHLRRWGVLDRLRNAALAPTAVVVRRARDAGLLAKLPLLDAERRWGAPYLVVHRADLQRALLAAVSERPEIELRLGVAVSGFASESNGVAIGAKHGMVRLRFDGEALIGADGLWSQVRERLAPDGDVPAKPARRTAWRATIPASDLPNEFSAPHVNLWLGRRGHVVHYPLRGGTCVNVVAIVEDTSAPGGSTSDFWTATGDPALLAHALSKWHPRAKALLSAGGEWRTWPLFDRPRLGRWGAGRITLLGDAAHPMLPFLAQGAAQAIEDAGALQSALSAHDDLAIAFAAYEGARRKRAADIQEASRRQGDIYHLGGPAAFARDIVMRVLGANGMLARQNWLYQVQQ